MTLYLIISPLGVLLLSYFVKPLKTLLTLAISAFTLNLSLIFYKLKCFDPASTLYQYKAAFAMFLFGVDGFSLWLLFIVNVTLPIVLLNAYKNNNHPPTLSPKTFYRLLILIGLLSNVVFLAMDVLLFYIAFETVLVPLFIMIGLYGGSNKRIKALYLLIIYTLKGSLCLLLAILYLYLILGTTNLLLLLMHQFSHLQQTFLGVSFLFAFFVKLPSFPFHIWLPVVHTESPTAGSVILAAILLKLGSYGVIRFVLPLFPKACTHYTPLIQLLLVLSILYSCILAISLIDIKQVIAYSSIIHMNKSLIGLFSNSPEGISGSYKYSITHGIIASGLFLIIGNIYERFHTRNIKYLRGMVLTYPVLVSFYFIFTLANTSLPLTAGFIPEFKIYLSSISLAPLTLFLIASCICLLPFYFISIYHRLSFGSFSPYFYTNYSDINIKELHQYIPLILFMILLGLYPKLLKNSLLI